jgi:hypothetical protein
VPPRWCTPTAAKSLHEGPQVVGRRCQLSAAPRSLPFAATLRQGSAGHQLASQAAQPPVRLRCMPLAGLSGWGLRGRKRACSGRRKGGRGPEGSVGSGNDCVRQGASKM